MWVVVVEEKVVLNVVKVVVECAAEGKSLIVVVRFGLVLFE